jgi:quercetin dioxygenase-like cupin family protein
MKRASEIPRIRSKVVRLTFAFAALAALIAGQVGPVAAGQATATAAEPITIETLGTGMPSSTPGQAILLLRITLQPGAAFPAHVHPGALVIAVESGDFAFTVISGQAEATRAIASGTPEATETLAAGKETVFHAGDEIFEQEGIVHTARNTGDAPAVVLVAALVDPTKPFLQPMTGEMAGMATPTP